MAAMKEGTTTNRTRLKGMEKDIMFLLHCGKDCCYYKSM